MRTISIIILSVFIFLIFSFITLLSIPWIFASQHQAVAFLGIFLILFTIPIMVFIFLKRRLKIIHIFYYLIYFMLTSYTNLILSTIIQKLYFYKFHFSFKFSQFLDFSNIFFFSLFCSLQIPIMILCIMIKQIRIYNEIIDIKFFIKNPLIYIFIQCQQVKPLIQQFDLWL
jgi:hypothetical protein